MSTILSILGIGVCWFIAGAIINFVAYANIPLEQRGYSEGAKGAHILLNAIAIILVVLTIVG
jgi:hypothetical protein